MKCPNCGHQLKPNAKFCGYCQYQLSLHEQVENNASFRNWIKCPYCGSLNKPQAKFCGQCSQPLTQHFQPKQQPHLTRTRSHRKSHSCAKIIALIIIILFIGGGFHHFYKDHISSEITQTTSNTITKPQAKQKLHNLWNSAQDSINNGNEEDMASFFTNNNKSYEDLSTWTHLESKNKNLRHTTLTPKLINVSSSNGDAVIKYNVNYVFRYPNKTNYQQLKWTAIMKKYNNNWKVINNSANKRLSYNIIK